MVEPRPFECYKRFVPVTIRSIVNRLLLITEKLKIVVYETKVDEATGLSALNICGSFT